MERHVYDINQPQGSMSLENLRNSLRALFQLDLMPLRPRASMILDDFEYPTDAQAQAEWSGSGCTISKSVTKQEGNYALQVEVDSTGNRTISRNLNLDLSAFSTLKVWERCSATSSAIQFFVKDNSGNESYWDVITNASANTWQQDSLNLLSPDSNNGANADLANITLFGFKGLDASATYIFDTIKAIVGMSVAVEGYDRADFHRHVWFSESAPLNFTAKSSPVITAPSANPRIDLLVVDSSGNLSWITGQENSSPVPPDSPSGKIPICYVYCKTTSTRIVDYEDKDANPNEGYIYKDVRPFLAHRLQSLIKDIDGDTKVQTEESADEDKIRFDTAGTERAVLDSSGLKLELGTSVKEFSTDGTLSDNSDSAVPTEKAVKSALSALMLKHYIDGNLGYSGTDVSVYPHFLWLNGEYLTRNSAVTVGVNISGNYAGTDKSGSSGWVYIYACSDGAGGYSIKLSGDPPDRSDCLDSATSGFLRYRNFNSNWYRFIGSINKDTASSIRPHFRIPQGKVQWSSFIQVASGTVNPAQNYTLTMPVNSTMADLLIKETATNTKTADQWMGARPAGSNGSYFTLSHSYSASGDAYLVYETHFSCICDGSQRIEIYSNCSDMVCYQTGYWDFR